jgi:hypothetical protein
MDLLSLIRMALAFIRFGKPSEAPPVDALLQARFCA